MNAKLPLDKRVVMQKRAFYLADSGLTEVMKPDIPQSTLTHGKVLVETIAAGVEPLELRRKENKNIRFDLATYDLDA